MQEISKLALETLNIETTMWLQDQHQRKNPTSTQKPGNIDLSYSNLYKANKCIYYKQDNLFKQ